MGGLGHITGRVQGEKNVYSLTLSLPYIPPYIPPYNPPNILQIRLNIVPLICTIYSKPEFGNKTLS